MDTETIDLNFFQGERQILFTTGLLRQRTMSNQNAVKPPSSAFALSNSAVS